uniref:Neurexin 1 n=1 Tax=Pongo abelii TaxID=9601 RepID=A0A8I5U8K5_PONAB
MRLGNGSVIQLTPLDFLSLLPPSREKKCTCSVGGKEEYIATFKGSEYFCYDLSQNPIQSSSDEITLSFKTLQRNGLMLHTGKSADYVNLALKNGAVSLVINLGSGAFEALVEPVNGKFNDNAWHDVKVTRNLRQIQRESTFTEDPVFPESNGTTLNSIFYYCLCRIGGGKQLIDHYEGIRFLFFTSL